MSNKKLSLHIGEKNIVTISSGITDISATPMITGTLNLNRQVVTGFPVGNGDNPPITFISAHATIGLVNLPSCVNSCHAPCNASKNYVGNHDCLSMGATCA